MSADAHQVRGSRARDTVALLGVRARGHHGVLPEERRDGQDFVVDVTMTLDVAAAAATDDLGDTVDYGAVGARVVAEVEGEPVDLVETLAQRIADAVLENALVQEVEIVVHKPQAPVGVPFGDVVVTVTRGRA
jgi:dihydroneopterin aldolase